MRENCFVVACLLVCLLVWCIVLRLGFHLLLVLLLMASVHVCVSFACSTVSVLDDYVFFLVWLCCCSLSSCWFVNKFVFLFDGGCQLSIVCLCDGFCLFNARLLVCDCCLLVGLFVLLFVC